MSWHTPRRSAHAEAAVVRTEVTSWQYSKASRTKVDIARTVVATSWRRTCSAAPAIAESAVVSVEVATAHPPLAR
jgi:hypothetical protein